LRLRLLFQMQVGLHRHGRVFRPPKVHGGYADAGIWSSW
jgi:hypothetical protein